ncbi:MAG: DNA-deoxyinosine glycosylase [Xanthomonadaceae bacterium]|nr:DNA-deoxyinosine glycosylase [Xanthomonadaceae bacterium]
MPRRPKSPLPDLLPETPAANGPDHVQSFAPRLGRRCRVLILGSMPGARSLAAGQYYAHPQNQFWPTMQAVFGVDAALPYERRIAGLQACGVGLWDVLHGCERRGSLDSAITAESEVPNAIADLLAQRCDIAVLAFNGAKAAQAFRRHVAAQIAPSRLAALSLRALPSTSPAHASMSRDEKLRRWSILAAPAG